MSCELTTNVRSSPCQSTSLTLLPILSQLLSPSLWERAKKMAKALKWKNPLMQSLPYLKHLHICLQSAAFERIFQAWDRGEKNLPSEAGLGMSYRLLRGWKSLGPDHGFSIQLQPRPGSRGEASPPALVKG